MKRVCHLFALAWLLALPVLHAQPEPELFELRGRAASPDGAPLPGVDLTLKMEGREDRVLVTDENGRFSFEGLQPGPYRLIVKTPWSTFEHSAVLGPETAQDRLVIECAFEGPGVVRTVRPTASIAPPGLNPDKGYAEVEVFYGTDRELRRDKPLEERFGPMRMRMQGEDEGLLHLGVCKVSVPRDHRMGEIERPSIWKLDFEPDPRKHMVLLGLEELGPNGFYGRLQGTLGKSVAKEMLVFVHGYNVNFHDAVLRTAQLAYDLGVDGAPVLYSWPSQASLSGYTQDEDSVRATVFSLAPFLRNLATRSGARSIYLVAHSMGNRALTDALDRIAMAMRGNDQPLFKEILLTAPDVNAQVFANLAKSFRRAGKRVTLYASSKDGALKASKKVHGWARAGETEPEVLVLSGIDTVDVSQVDTSLLGHSYFGDNCSVIADMQRLMRDGKAPHERSPLTKKEKGPGLAYWVFPAGAACPRPPG